MIRGLRPIDWKANWKICCGDRFRTKAMPTEFEKCLSDRSSDDGLDMATRRKDGKIYYGFPVAILVS